MWDHLMSAVRDKCRVFVGVGNGATTAQGLAEICRTGITVYAVDTASRSRIFHPKVYLASNPERATVIVGSPNLTHAGLHNNIEASALIELDLNEEADRVFLEKIRDSIDLLPERFPEHCFAVNSGRQLVEMIRLGLLVDERIQRGREKEMGAPEVVDRVGADVESDEDAQARRSSIGLPFVAGPQGSRRLRRQRVPEVRAERAGREVAGNGEAAAEAQPVEPQAAPPVPTKGILLWEKPRLPRGDLQLLNVGHSSGVLRLTQARFQVGGQVIDQTTYFRHDMFGRLAWERDPASPDKEMASTEFSLVINGEHVGDFMLKISHKPAWEAGQGNYTTGLHWGEAVHYVQDESLLHSTLRIYAPVQNGMPYTIEIG